MSSATRFARQQDRPHLDSAAPFRLGGAGYNVAVILWGAVVRATSSGAGCGDHWPLCNGVVVQSNPRLATLIELGSSSEQRRDPAAVLLLLVWTFRSRFRDTLHASPSSPRCCSPSTRPCLVPCWCCYGSPRTTVRRRARFIFRCTWPIRCCYWAHSRLWRTSSRRRRVHPAHHTLHATAAGHGTHATLLVGVTGTSGRAQRYALPATSLALPLRRTSPPAVRMAAAPARFFTLLTAVIAGLFICWLLLRSIARPSERKLALLVFSLLVLQLGLVSADVALLARPCGCRSPICWERTYYGLRSLCSPPEFAFSAGHKSRFEA